jgi:hypothetical protein
LTAIVKPGTVRHLQREGLVESVPSRGAPAGQAPAERPYAFRRRLAEVHAPDRRDLAATPSGGEVVLDCGWSVVAGAGCAPPVLNAARDLQDYLFTSMGLSVRLLRVDDAAAAARDGERVVVLTTRDEAPEHGAALAAAGSYRLFCTASRVVVCGADPRGAFQGSAFLEDLMNLRRAPFLEAQDVVRTPRFSPRMTHSGWALDDFPDAHLNAIAHAGMDAVLVFVCGVDRTPDQLTLDHPQPFGGRYLDVNDLVDRAAGFGLDVYFYAYFRSMSPPHPDDPGAARWYDETYGALFRACPRAKGIVLVGESVEFPSKDPRTSGTLRHARPPGAPPPDRPTPGWWPATDWVDWLDLLKRVIRPHNPQADIVFWTYNWGYAPEADRLDLIRALPRDVSLLVTFEMFEPVTRNGLTNMCADYTLSFTGPGRYFASEARAASERGLRLYTMCNTGGLTWDVGVIPYEPAPFQWARRHAALLEAKDAWGLSGLMEGHHYGFWPSFVSELAKRAYWSPAPPAEDTLEAIARRDFGPGAGHALDAWRSWSEAIQDYVATGHDQYGPFRIGPSYPLVFQEPVALEVDWYAMHGAHIARTDYAPGMGRNSQLPEGQRLDVPRRVPLELRSLERMAAGWRRGVEQMERAVALTPPARRTAARFGAGIGRFVLHAVVTAVHTKRWWVLKQRLLAAPAPAAAGALLDEMAALVAAENANAAAAIPLVRADSRLGWEPTMGYLTDEAHLRWKIAQGQRLLADELPRFRRALETASGTGDRGRSPQG